MKWFLAATELCVIQNQYNQRTVRPEQSSNIRVMKYSDTAERFKIHDLQYSITGQGKVYIKLAM